MTSLRLFFIGGILSYRALFSWLSPWIFIPTLLILPVMQILLFVYVGRRAGIESDEFFVIGNAVQCSATPCLVAMASTIVGERRMRTLGLVLSTPARRIPMFLGRSLPVIGNAWFVSLFSLVVGGFLLRIRIPSGAWLPIALVVLVACISCTGLALVLAALGLRLRDISTLSNITYGVLLIFCGVNVPLHLLPRWMSAVAQYLPLTHAIEAARRLAGGGSFSSVQQLLVRELALGAMYAVLGLAALRYLEVRSRTKATLEAV